MTSLLLRTIFMEELPTSDKAAALFFELIAVGCACTSAESFAKRDYDSGAIWLVLTFVLAVGGVYWSKIRRVARLKRISGLIAIACGMTIATLPFVFHWHERFLRLIRDPHWYAAVIVTLGFYSLIYAIIYVRAIRRDFNVFCRPRSVSREQAEKIRRCLSAQRPHSMILKINASDAETNEYGTAILAAIRSGGWTVDLDTSDRPPVSQIGLGIAEYGSGTGQPGETRRILVECLRHAKIEVPGGSSDPSGQYKLYLLVGKRPFRINVRPPLYYRIGRWFIRRANVGP